MRQIRTSERSICSARLCRWSGLSGVTCSALTVTNCNPGARWMPSRKSRYISVKLDVVGEWYVIWPIAMIRAENRSRWKSGALRPDLLAFGDPGTGEPFCFRGPSSEVVIWHPIGEEVQILAPDVASFWRGWVTGAITT